MATDVEVQYFSHLNGLVLGNNWGDMIRLLDTCLVNGLPFSAITSASIDEQGDITLNLYSAHKAMLFQIVELTGFTPNELNGKYRIKGTPTATQLILKATHAGKIVTVAGSAKLASLGYDIIFRDSADVKRAYRAKNPRSEHPFIRVDESLTSSDGTSGVYNSGYAKYAMIGLLESMAHIDDYGNPDVLQLPFDPSNSSKNWEISGVGGDVIRGWSKWVWSRGGNPNNSAASYADSDGGTSGSSFFTLCGNKDAFYNILNLYAPQKLWKVMQGCGLFNAALPVDIVPNWFLMARTDRIRAKDIYNYNNNNANTGLVPLVGDNPAFVITKYDIVNRLSSHISCNGIMLNNQSGYSDTYFNSDISAMQIPIADISSRLRGELLHLYFAAKRLGEAYEQTTPLLSESSMYVAQDIIVDWGYRRSGGFYFYIGELE